MLVRLKNDEAGVALVMVVSAVLLLSIIAAMLLTNVVSAARYTTETAATVAARAAADAGVDVMTAEFATGNLPPCGEVLTGTSPHFEVSVLNYIDEAGEHLSCSAPLSGVVPRSAQVISHGWDQHGAQHSVMAELATSPDGDGAAFFSGQGASIDGIRLPEIVGGSADVIVKEGDLRCNQYSEIHGNVIVNGNVEFTNKCHVMGNLIVAGTVRFSVEVHIHGDLIVTGTDWAGTSIAASNQPIKVGGNIYANGHITGALGNATSPAQIQVTGDVVTRGNVNLFRSSVGGHIWAGGDFRIQDSTVTGDVLAVGDLANLVAGSVINGALQVGGDLRVDGGVCPQGGANAALAACLLAKQVVKSRVVAYLVPGVPVPPVRPKPDVPSWIDIPFVQRDWELDGFTFIAHNATLYNCGFANWDSASKARIEALSTPSVLDMRPCGSSMYLTGSLSPRTDLVFLISGAQLNNLTIRPWSSGDTRKVWFLVPDQTVDAQPSCTGGAGNITLHKADVGQGAQALMYTPCTLTLGGGSTVTGQLYAGKTNVSGEGNVLVFEPTPVPGVNLGAGVGGGALDGVFIRSRFDVRSQ